jgi:cell division protein FtsB
MRQQVGVGAQSVQAILPAAVFRQRDNELGLNYGGATSVATVELAKRAVTHTEEIKELKDTVAAQATEITQLKDQMAIVLQRLAALEA